MSEFIERRSRLSGHPLDGLLWSKSTLVCPHCGVTAHIPYDVGPAARQLSDETKYRGWDAGLGLCPACDRPIVVLRYGTWRFAEPPELNKILDEKIVWPLGIAARPLGSEVPVRYAAAYREACAVVNVSAKASAALSRRLLQDVIREHYGIKHRSLEREIHEFLAQHQPPALLRAALDAVRQVGNFAAHPLKDTHTGEIIDVEPGEASWLVELLEIMLDFAFVQAHRTEERRQRLQEKLEAAGKVLPQPSNKPLQPRSGGDGGS